MNEVLKELLKDSTAGDPMGGLHWTHKSMRKLAVAIKRRGIEVSHVTIGRLMSELKFSLRTNRKRLAKTHDPNRDQQFRLLTRRRNNFQCQNWPIISIDCKKKELIGNFKNPGKTWRTEALDVYDHDFPSWADGRVVPFGIYDIAKNRGFMVVGICRETSAFVINAIRTWWLTAGRLQYPGATRLAIECDCGGGNGPRQWAWKVGLQRLADEFGLTITVGHFPPGASKWNFIEHRMFSLISGNWAGEPLISYTHVLNYIRSTRSTKGFRCRAILDKKDYPKKQCASTEEKEHVRLSLNRVLPKWNYTVRPTRTELRNGQVIF